MSSPKSGKTKENDLAQILVEVEESLAQLQSRHTQVKEDWEKRSHVLARQQELEDGTSPQPLKTELRSLQQELDDLELNLESVLLPDIFWQVVRFVFLGIAIGWFLHLWAA